MVSYNLTDGIYQADPLNRLTSVERSFDGASYRTEYQYNSAKPALLAGIRYPEADRLLQYNYDGQNRVDEVVGFTKPQGIRYNADDTLQKISYANGVITNFTYDAAQRLKDLTVDSSGVSIMEQHYTYKYQTDNIETVSDGKATKTFTYDANNQLVKSVTPGKFMENESSPGSYGIKIGDYLGAKFMDFMPTLTAMMGLDYYSSSIGIDFGSVAPGVKKIQVIPDGSYTSHRITERTLDLYISGDNSTYTIIPRSNWSFVKDTQGIITITLKESVTTRYLKVHVKFDERDTSFTAKNKATFLNDLAKMLRVYQEATSQTEEFQYDAAGNRTYQRVTLIRAKSYTSAYYANSDRLKTDGKYAFVYDAAGNLVNKGNKFSINGDRVTFTQTSGDGVEYWQYTYDLLNRLTEVKKNGTVVAGYEYSPDGLRQVKRGGSGTIHYVFEGTEPIFEKRISDSRVRSYVYVLGKHLARVDGMIGDTAAKAYYYHTDQVGSVKAVTDSAGKVVFNADYFAFGTKYTSNGDFDETHGFTGKEYDSDTGLYYYNARWYDSDLGRFISEDPVMDPNNPNLYTYCANNPLKNIDPTGYSSEGSESSDSSAGNSIGSAISNAISAICGAISNAVSAISQAISSAVSSIAQGINSAVSSVCNALSNAWSSITGNKGERGTFNNPTIPGEDSDPAKFIKDRMKNDPFHGDDRDKSGSSSSSTDAAIFFAKEFGPQLPDFSRTESYIPQAIEMGKTVIMEWGPEIGTYIARGSRAIWGGIITGYISAKIYFASKDKSKSLPMRGKPGSVAYKYGKNGEVIQERHYDENGDADYDVDYSDHGNPKVHENPHKHTWNNGKRGGQEPANNQESSK
jgi:RHS repeat-associated protein